MIDWLVVGAAFLSGLLGSAHCAAMCGGIATAISIRQRGGWLQALQPNLGRVLGYAAAGALVGGIGRGLVDLASPQLGLVLRTAVGLVLVVAALRLLDRRGRLAALATPGQRLWRWLRPLQRPLLPADTAARRLVLGLLWGWMPCGLSSTLLAAAWLQADAGHGALTMTAFGLGTLPVMLPLTWSGARLGQRLQRSGWRTAAGGVVLGAGVLTLAGPWLMHAPAVHGVLAALGCRSLAA
ncbi:sulfite exporter TauE/SafE family protein [Coralloluteibacterium stylophorae]|uniref:Sulfite exporter TauE/SafE family protein n=1 Tax=Coralloluteibacterium stylophorae TaxID=1776034 RepID=A0A8J8AY57_9GAMM|nr:sulfite exporter TauE/SafE family protein [Coralloluteibacterium stylophorae]MBS7457421.1 sulfite exporter TauE/SafE family protein [Coralloluteibacterium stylophorae]